MKEFNFLFPSEENKKVWTLAEIAKTFDKTEAIIYKITKEFDIPYKMGKGYNNITTKTFDWIAFRTIKDILEGQLVERPLYTNTQLARISKVPSYSIQNLALQNDIERIIKTEKKGKVCYYTPENALKLLELARNQKKKWEQKKQTGNENTNIEELKKLHPLVKDVRFFNLSYFPDTIPLCFADIDE